MLESGFFCLLFLAVEEKYGRPPGMAVEKRQGCRKRQRMLCPAAIIPLSSQLVARSSLLEANQHDDNDKLNNADNLIKQ